MGTWGLDPNEPGAPRYYKQKLERFMRFELDPDAGMRGEFEKQIKRGWYLGVKDFGDKLLERIHPRERSALQGAERKAHGQAEAERLLENALNELSCTEDELKAMQYNHPEKQAVAWLLHSQTTVTVTWVAERLNMGHRSNAARGLSRIRTATDTKTKRLRTRMSQCTD